MSFLTLAFATSRPSGRCSVCLTHPGIRGGGYQPGHPGRIDPERCQPPSKEQTKTMQFPMGYCLVTAEKRHYSDYSNDASYHTFTRCFYTPPEGGRYPVRVRKIRTEGVGRAYLPHDLVNTSYTFCEVNATRRNSQKDDRACHGAYYGPGTYTGGSTVYVTNKLGVSRRVFVYSVAFLTHVGP